MKKAFIKTQNTYSWLTTNSEEVSTVLWKALRFREKNFFHSRLYKQGKWDGYTEFYKKISGRFLTGLLPEVKAALKYLGVSYNITDERNTISLQYNEINKHFLGDFNKGGRPIVLEDYQVDYTNQILKHRRGIILAPTASGKTLVMMCILKCLNEKTPALVLTNKKGLAQQNYEEMQELGIERAGVLHSDCKKPNIITCSTWQSLHRLEKLLPYVRVVIVDEIHEMMSNGPKKFYNKLKGACMRVAVSATPFKFGGKDKPQKYSVKGYFGPVMKTKSAAAEKGVLTTKKLQEHGRLSKTKCTFFPVTEPQMPYAIYMDAVEKGISQNLSFNNMVCKLARSLKGRTLVIVERLPHGDLLHNLMPESLWIQGKDNLKTRKEVIDRLQEFQDDVIAIATQGIFNTGLNVKAHNLINAAGGQAEHVIIQRFGRGLRIADDKEYLDYFDFIFKINDYLEGHSKNRIKILKKEGHEITIKDSFIF